MDTYTASKSGTGVSLPYDGGSGHSTASWKIEYQTFNTSMKNHVIVDQLTDEYTAGMGSHQYKKDSFKVNLGGEDKVLAEGTGKAIVGGDLNYSLEFSDSDRKLTFIINGGDKVTSSTYNYIALKYDTQFDLSEMDDSPATSSGQIELTNGVVIKDNNNQVWKKPDTKNTINKVVSQNGKKFVSYDTETGKRIFTWTAELNHKGKTIPAGDPIVDKLSGGPQRYLPDSIEVHQAELTAIRQGTDKLDGDTLDNHVLLTQGDDENSGDYMITYLDYEGDELAKPVAYDGIKDGNGNIYHKGMAIQFTNDINTPIVITYQTEAVGESEETYGNEITLLGKTHESSIKYKEYDEIIDKKAVLEKNAKIYKGDILDWEIVVNKSLSKIYDFTLTDAMGKGLILIPETLKICKSADKDRELNDSFTIVYGSPEDAPGNDDDILDEFKGFTISTVGKTPDYIEDEYTVTYSTLVNTDEENNISNTALILGMKLSQNNVTEPTYTTSSRRGGIGGGTTGGGDENIYEIRIKKVVAAPDNTPEEVIAQGTAKFALHTLIELYDSEGGKLVFEQSIIEELETKGGTVTFVLEDKSTGTQVYTYTIEEIEAPEGYIKSDQIFEVDFAKADTDNIITLAVPNARKSTDKIIAVKEWENKDTESDELPAVTFQLYSQINGDSESKEPVDEEIVLNGADEETPWQYEWTDLPATDLEGNEYTYTVDEINVPNSYEKTISSETAEADGITTTTFTITNTYYTFAIGDYTWIDSNRNGIQDPGEKVLEGVEVELYDSDRNLLSTTTTNSDGLYLFDELEEGEYYVKFILTPDQAKVYRFTSLDAGDNDHKDSDADPATGWTKKIELNKNNKNLITDAGAYDGLTFTATVGIDPTWDAGVVLRSTGGGGSKKPEDPTDPEEPEEETPDEPEEPEEPELPVEPEEPEPPQPVEPPKYEVPEVPDPQDPDSPDEFILVDDNDTPLGHYKKHQNPDGTFVYLDENNIPYGGPKLPQTGDYMPVSKLSLAFVISLLLVAYVYRRTNTNQHN